MRFVVQRHCAVDKNEFLDGLSGEVLEPECDLVPVRLHRSAEEVDTAEGAWVRGEDGGHRVGEATRVSAEAEREVAAADPDGGGGEEVGVDEDERRRVPDAAPARGEHGGARGILDGESGDDAAEDPSWEETDAVDPIGGSRRDGAGEGGGVGGRRVREVDEGALRQCEHGLVHPKEIEAGDQRLSNVDVHGTSAGTPRSPPPLRAETIFEGCGG